MKTSSSETTAEQEAMVIAETLCQMLEPDFTDLLQLKSMPLDFTMEIDPVHKLSAFELSSCLALIDNNLGTFYKARHGTNWKVDKAEEMQELGLIYVRFKIHQDPKLFVSFMVVEDNGLKVLYIYEMQIAEGYRRSGMGTLIMGLLQDFTRRLNDSLNLDIVGMSLTCFSDNDRLLLFYKKTGFKKASYSPRNKVLRTGKVLKPEYYILLKRI